MQWIGPWKFAKWRKPFYHRVQKRRAILNRDGGAWNSTVSPDLSLTHIYQVGLFKFRLLVIEQFTIYGQLQDVWLGWLDKLSHGYIWPYYGNLAYFTRFWCSQSKSIKWQIYLGTDFQPCIYDIYFLIPGYLSYSCFSILCQSLMV